MTSLRRVPDRGKPHDMMASDDDYSVIVCRCGREFSGDSPLVEYGKHLVQLVYAERASASATLGRLRPIRDPAVHEALTQLNDPDETREGEVSR